MSDNFREAFGINDQDDDEYRAWRTCQQGATMYFKLVPLAGSGQPVRHIPYLQAITIEHHPESDQLCLLCHGTGMTVFIEGRGLAELANQIAEKRVKSIHVLDETAHRLSDNSEAIVTEIKVEQS